jgi:hypothetical protein
MGIRRTSFEEVLTGNRNFRFPSKHGQQSAIINTLIPRFPFDLVTRGEA